MGLVAVGALLFAFFLLIVAVMVVQEARKAQPGPPVYVIEEVVPFAFRRLSDGAMARLDVDDVQRILEWEVFYLQGLASRSNGAEGVGGPIAGSPEAVDFIHIRASGAGYDYEVSDIEEVLSQEAAYLVDIGAVGPPVAGDSDQ